MSKLDNKLQQLYDADKATVAMPAQLQQQLSGLNRRSKSPHYWPQAAAAVLAILALAYVWQQDSYYQIQTVQQAGYHQVQLHQLTEHTDSAQPERWQQRYQQYEQAKQTLAQQQALVGQLLFEQQQWQVAVCDQLLVKLDQQLAEQLRQDQSWRQGQTVELVRGQQGQILAIRSSERALHCAAG
ncbi:hypothetical protein [Rheinheimera sp.]|uniref:hypothetical protein n=1 Tax=Rheinheimera sp. TaxID=1869214 RepID=UPI00307DB892